MTRPTGSYSDDHSHSGLLDCLTDVENALDLVGEALSKLEALSAKSEIGGDLYSYAVAPLLDGQSDLRAVKDEIEEKLTETPEALADAKACRAAGTRSVM